VSRPTVDVIVPFVGSAAERAALIARFDALERQDGDTLTIVDNGPAPGPEHPLVLHAPERQTSYFARNRGAERGDAEWLLFLDADVLPPADLLPRMFGAPIGERVGVIAGGVRDEEHDDVAALPLASRYAAMRAPMSQEHTLPSGYAQTANAAFRRTAFEQVGGFAEEARSGGDADICFRLRDAGWELEYRPEGMVIHRNRTTLKALLRQRARHGSGTAWVNRRHPGTMPAGAIGSLLPPAARKLAGAVAHAHLETARMATMDLLCYGAFLAGRLLPNEKR
jgi:cellulose synthase/poly-beta-1,6-N-acetylglucosamine synthase-like glycosyltransferase